MSIRPKPLGGDERLIPSWELADDTEQLTFFKRSKGTATGHANGYACSHPHGLQDWEAVPPTSSFSARPAFPYSVPPNGREKAHP